MSADGRQYKSGRKKAAEMEYISYDLDVQATVDAIDNFEHAHTIDARDFQEPEGLRKLEEYVRSWVIVGGRPLVIQNYHKLPYYPHYIFSPDWLAANHDRQREFNLTLIVFPLPCR